MKLENFDRLRHILYDASLAVHARVAQIHILSKAGAEDGESVCAEVVNIENDRPKDCQALMLASFADEKFKKSDPGFMIEATETHNGNMVELWFAKNEEKEAGNAIQQDQQEV